MTRLKGHYLIASPKLMDPNFFHTVLLMVEHDEGGSMGVVLNRPTGQQLSDVWTKVSDAPCLSDAKLYYGGPCEGPLMLLHTDEYASDLQVAKNLHFTTEEDQVRRLVESSDGPIKAFLGYAGWVPGQLEAELECGSWLHVKAATRDLFRKVPDWDQLLKELTPNVLEVRVVPSDPSLN